MNTDLERRVSQPANPRAPRTIQAVLLLSSSSLAVMVTAVLGPSVPQMQRYFAAEVGVEYLVPLSVTIPMLVMAGLSVFAGVAADRVGRKRMLVLAMLCYAAIGTAPMWLNSLSAIIAARLLLGVFDAMIMTASTVMIGDYYQGERRQRMLALATTVSSISAVVITELGGLLGEMGWRAPYAVYGVALLLAPLMQLFLWESKPAAKSDAPAIVIEDFSVVFRPYLLAGICAVGLFVGVVFILAAIHLGFLMGSLGVTSSQAIGASAALSSFGVVIGTLLFGWVVGPRMRVPYQLASGFAIAGAGLIAMAISGSYGGLTVAAVLNGIGCGILLPTVSTWNMRELPFERRGLGTGAFMSATFLGMAINPIIVVFIAGLLHSRAAAVGALGWFMIGGTVVTVISSFGRHRKAVVA